MDRGDVSHSIDLYQIPFVSEDVIIKDNSITNSKKFGIRLQPPPGSKDPVANTVVIGNTFAGNTDGPIDDNGTDTVFSGNVPNLM